MLLLEHVNQDTVETVRQLFNKLSGKFFMRLFIDSIAVFILVRFIYYPRYKKNEMFFTFFIFNLIIFLITFLLNKVELSMGAAFGLFAVFSMLRYRTEGISSKDMTYLFLTIALGLICAVTKGSWDELGLLSLILLGVTYFLESGIFLKRESSRKILYENIQMIQSPDQAALIEDLQKRTGLKIHRLSIERVDFLRDVVYILVYYYE